MKIRRYLCLRNKLLASIVVARAETKWRRPPSRRPPSRRPWTRDPYIKLLCLGSTSCLIKLESYWRHISEMYLQVNSTFRIFVIVNTATVAENVLATIANCNWPGDGAFHFLSIIPPLWRTDSNTLFIFLWTLFKSASAMSLKRNILTGLCQSPGVYLQRRWGRGEWTRITPQFVYCKLGQLVICACYTCRTFSHPTNCSVSGTFRIIQHKCGGHYFS